MKNNFHKSSNKIVISNHLFLWISIIIFALSLILFLIGIYAFEELREKHYYLSNIQLILTIVVPYTLTLTAFSLQIILYNKDLKNQLKIHAENYSKLENNSKFFSILENINYQNEIYVSFFYQIFERFNKDLDNLNNGMFFERGKSWQYLNRFICNAKIIVECTSIIPPQEWQTPEMDEYQNEQKESIKKNNIKIERTFIFENKERRVIRPFDKIFTRQILDNIQIYILFKEDFIVLPNGLEWEIVYKDFAFIDSQILIDAQFSNNNTLDGYEFIFKEFCNELNEIKRCRKKIEQLDSKLFDQSTISAIQTIKK